MSLVCGHGGLEMLLVRRRRRWVWVIMGRRRRVRLSAVTLLLCPLHLLNKDRLGDCACCFLVVNFYVEVNSDASSSHRAESGTDAQDRREPHARADESRRCCPLYCTSLTLSSQSTSFAAAQGAYALSPMCLPATPAEAPELFPGAPLVSWKNF